ncbi:MAG: RNA degradosome polyphosphate kinase, partial [Silvibacterium sp.]|nr:RNA degradosome polyphosphate kinase [Silvibacterium sp.]
GGQEDIYAGSADWMPRNLFERCEVVFPIRDQQIRNRIRNEILAACLADTMKARALDKAGTYLRVCLTEAGRDLPAFNSQEFFMRLAEGKASIDDIPSAPAAEPHHHHAKLAKRVAAKEKVKAAAD